MGKHASRESLDAALAALPPAPRDEGRIRLIVSRPGENQRDLPESVSLSVEEGVPGDDWNRRPPHDPAAQLAVIRHDVATLIAAGQPVERLGDNLYVELDISDQNLPVGTRLSVGAATVEVTPKPHNGCSKFKERFGLDALHFVQDKATRAENRRGIYWRVVEAGLVRVNDPIRVLARSA
ncbi:MAG: MOSC domain-containing protein [Myxococcota bacterium]